MNKKLLVIGIIAAILIFTLISPFIFTKQLFEFAISQKRKEAGLVKKEIKINDDEIYYLEGGKGLNILLIHGFGADKDNWIMTGEFLTKDFHVIALDLPGFGESSKFINAKYDVISQVERLNSFVDKIGLNKFNIAGNSMGGHIAAAFTINHPEKISSLCLIDAGGVKSLNKSELDKLRDNGVNTFNFESRKDYYNLMKLTFTHEPKIPKAIMNYLADNSIKNNDFNNKIGKQMQDNPYPLEPGLNKIKIPVLIIWGKEDRIIDISAVKVFEAGLKNHKTVIINNCGHVPMIEKPEETAKEYINFLKGI